MNLEDVLQIMTVAFVAVCLSMALKSCCDSMIKDGDRITKVKCFEQTKNEKCLELK